jgi:hypothetical protein
VVTTKPPSLARTSKVRGSPVPKLGTRQTANGVCLDKKVLRKTKEERNRDPKRGSPSSRTQRVSGSRATRKKPPNLAQLNLLQSTKDKQRQDQEQRTRERVEQLSNPHRFPTSNHQTLEKVRRKEKEALEQRTLQRITEILHAAEENPTLSLADSEEGSSQESSANTTNLVSALVFNLSRTLTFYEENTTYFEKYSAIEYKLLETPD